MRTRIRHGPRTPGLHHHHQHRGLGLPPQPVAGAREAEEVGDRAEAILVGVDGLQAGDCLLIAGKGHETGQIIGEDVLPFDDVEQASISVAALEDFA